MNNFMQLVNSNVTLNDNINSSQSTYFLPFILANNNNNTNTISIMNLPKWKHPHFEAVHNQYLCVRLA